MRLSDIDLRLLRVFKAVAEAGGFVKAQDELSISQPAISTQIAKLEDRLNLRLCERGPKGFSLTPAGEKVFEETKQLLEHVDATATRLLRIGNEPKQRIRFGVVDCLLTEPNNPLIPEIRKLRDVDPTLKVKVGVYDFIDCLAELRSARLDIAIIGVDADETIPKDLESLYLFEETSGLFCAPDHPCCGVTDLGELKSILAGSNISAHSFAANPIDEDLKLDLMDRNDDIAQDNIESTTYLTLAGTHVGLIPLNYAAYWVDQGQMVPVAPEIHQAVSKFHAVRVKTEASSQAADRVWDALRIRSIEARHS